MPYEFIGYTNQAATKALGTNADRKEIKAYVLLLRPALNESPSPYRRLRRKKT